MAKVNLNSLLGNAQIAGIAPVKSESFNATSNVSIYNMMVKKFESDKLKFASLVTGVDNVETLASYYEQVADNVEDKTSEVVKMLLTQNVVDLGKALKTQSSSQTENGLAFENNTLALVKVSALLGVELSTTKGVSVKAIKTYMFPNDRTTIMVLASMTMENGLRCNAVLNIANGEIKSVDKFVFTTDGFINLNDAEDLAITLELPEYKVMGFNNGFGKTAKPFTKAYRKFGM